MDNSLKKALETVNVFNFEDIAEFLKTLYITVKQINKESNTKYSYRKFSFDLGFGETNYLHLVCKKQRKLAVKSVEQISRSLQLKQYETEYVKALILLARAKNAHAAEKALSDVYLLRHKKLSKKSSGQNEKSSAAIMELLGKWYLPVIKELVGTPGFEEDPFWLAEKINPRVRATDLRDGLKLLEEHNFIKRDANGNLVQTNKNIQTPASIRSLTIKKYHQEMLELSRNSLKDPGAENKDFQALTLPVTKELMMEYKSEIHQLLGRLLAKSAEIEETEDILQLNVQMFLVTQSGKKP